MKVSILAMRLFLKRDRQYSLVLICANKPNVTLLSDISQELSIALNTQAIANIRLDADGRQTAPITYQVEKHIADACLEVQCSCLPEHTVRIMMTSPVFRSENYLHLNETIRQQIVELNPDPLDMLDKNKCLEAAAEIRECINIPSTVDHSLFFQVIPIGLRTVCWRTRPIWWFYASCVICSTIKLH